MAFLVGPQLMVIPTGSLVLRAVGNIADRNTQREYLVQPLDLLFQPFVGMLLWIIPLTLGLAGLKLLLVPLLRGRAGEEKVGRVLQRVADDVVHDIVLTDRRGNRTQIDHIALLPGGLLVIETKNFSGLIFGQAHDHKWTQRLGRTSNRFLNPLIQNKQHVEAVELAVPGVPVVGWVVFTDRSRFPKGRPEGVSQLSSFVRDIAGALPRAAGNPRLAEAWPRLKNPELASKAEKRAHLTELRSRRGPNMQGRLGWGLLLIAAALVIWLSLIDRPGQLLFESLRPVAQRLEDTVKPAVASLAPAAAQTAPRPPVATVTPPEPARHQVPSPRTRPMAKPPASAEAPKTPAAIATLEWSPRGASGESKTRESSACVKARMDLLIQYSAENARRQKFACGNP